MRSPDRLSQSTLRRHTHHLLQAPWRMLESEHDTVSEDLRALADLFKRLKGRKGTPQELETVHKTLEFFRRTLFTHMETEETIIFPYLKTHRLALVAPLDDLVEDHRRFRRYLPHLSLAYAAVQKRSSSERRWYAMAREGLKVVALLQRHIDKETCLMDDGPT